MKRSLFAKAGWVMVAAASLASVGYAARGSLTVPPPLPARDSAAAIARPAQPVRVTRVAFANVRDSESYTGTIRPQHEAPLAFRVPGQLIARMVEVGDRVVSGQVVARLDDTDARLELEVAEAELAAARTDLLRAEADVARSRTLFAAGHVAQAALDRATSAHAEALSRANRAAQSRGLALNRLSYMDLPAEADGIVTTTPAETGQVLAAGQPVLSVAQTDALDVVFTLPEQRRSLAETAAARAELWGAPDRTYALALRDISPDVDPVGRTYRVRMMLETPDAETALGRTVTVRLQTVDTRPAAALPLAAVVNTGTGAAVWRVPSGADKVERVPVELVAVHGQMAQVRGGLAEGDIVVSLGAHKLDPDRPVRAVETVPAPEG